MGASGPQHGSRRYARLAAALLLAAGLVGLAAPRSTDAPGSGAAAGSPDAIWGFADRRAAELEALWRPSESTYVMTTERHSTRLLANMLALHAYAALAGHTGAARKDARI